MLVPDAVRDVHPGHRAGYVADPRPRPMGAGMELAGRRRGGTTFPAEVSLAAMDTDEGLLVTSMGLATVYGIIHQAGGHARIHSEPGAPS